MKGKYKVGLCFLTYAKCQFLLFIEFMSFDVSETKFELFVKKSLTSNYITINLFLIRQK